MKDEFLEFRLVYEEWVFGWILVIVEEKCFYFGEECIGGDVVEIFDFFEWVIFFILMEEGGC